MTALYEYQRAVIAEFDRTREHKRRIILVGAKGDDRSNAFGRRGG